MSIAKKIIAMFGGTIYAEYLVVGGGAQGGTAVWQSLGRGGGGGAGGLKAGAVVLVPGSSHSIIVGQRGSNTSGLTATGSSFGDIASVSGGGRGANPTGNGVAGGSGGGGGNDDPGGTTLGGVGIVGQGHDGAGGNEALAGGGGGAGAPATLNLGGAGFVSSISGASVEYAKGGNGSGGGPGTTPGSGGGGTNGGSGPGEVGSDGANGIVIIRYIGPQRATGGTITTDGGYTIHTFTADGTFAPL